MPLPVPRRVTIVLLSAVLAALGMTAARPPRSAAATDPRAEVALLTGQTLASGQSLTSPDGHYTLTMMTDGNLVLELSNPYGSPRVTWSSGTGSSPGASAQLLANGNLVVDDASGATLWSSNVDSPGCANLDLQDDGNLVLYNPAGAYWASHTLQQTMQPDDELLPGQTIIAPGGHYELQMGTDGFLRMIDSSGAVWTSGGAPAGSYAVMDDNGALQIRSTGGNIDWSTKTDTSGDGGSTVQLTSDGAVQVVTPSGSTAWDSNSGTARTGLRYLGIPRSYTNCPAPPTTTTPTPTGPSPTPIHAQAPTTGSVTFILPSVRVSISVRWRFDGAVSWMSAATVRRFPQNARLTISCAGHGCPTRTLRRHGRRTSVREHFSATGAHVKALMRHLVGRRFHAGARVIFTVTEPGHRPERSEAIIRRGASPRSRVLH